MMMLIIIMIMTMLVVLGMIISVVNVITGNYTIWF